ncbi:MAG: alpha/beta hydrolase [Anaerohalosphaeraceae bacterium]
MPLLTSKRKKNQKERNDSGLPLLEPLEQVHPVHCSEQAKAYFAHYGLDCRADIEHLFGSFVSGPYQLAAHIYRPARYEAAVILLHGYLSHSGQLRHLLSALLENHFAAALFDWPGHGLSTGPHASINHFEEYTIALADFLQKVRARLHGPYFALGFSMGAAVLTDALLTGSVSSLERVILAAPLLRWTAYNLSKPLWKTARCFTDRIPRIQRKNSSDPEFLSFNRTGDFLHARVVSLQWVKALYIWNDKLQTLPPSDRDILILQPQKDKTVAWPYNLKILQNKFPAAQIHMLPGARHELFNEARPYRQAAIRAVLDYFSGKEPFLFSQKPVKIGLENNQKSENP